jgi:hypothetical protein
MKNRKAKQVVSGGLVSVGEEEYKERVCESQHGEILCTHVRKWKNETC